MSTSKKGIAQAIKMRLRIDTTVFNTLKHQSKIPSSFNKNPYEKDPTCVWMCILTRFLT